jgi:hypothetical protein
VWGQPPPAVRPGKARPFSQQKEELLILQAGEKKGQTCDGQ